MAQPAATSLRRQEGTGATAGGPAAPARAVPPGLRPHHGGRDWEARRDELAAEGRRAACAALAGGLTAAAYAAALAGGRP